MSSRHIRLAAIGCRAAGGWLLILSLVYAPCAWGAVKPPALRGLEGLLFAAALLWLLAALSPACRPKVPRALAWCCGVLIAWGWLMALNAHQAYNPAMHQFTPVAPWCPWLPGGMDRRIEVAAMLHLTPILLALLMACDLVREGLWVRRFFVAIAATGASVAAYGLGSKAGLFPPMWAIAATSTSVFGPFVYHGVAGAYLNLAIPAQLALAAVALRQAAYVSGRLFWRVARPALWLLAAVVTVAGVMVNISRGAALLCVLEIALLLLLLALALRHDVRLRSLLAARKPLLVVSLLLVAAIGGAAIYHNRARWKKFAAYFHPAHSGRVLQWRVELGMLRARPWVGSGPGSFKMRFPLSHHMLPKLYVHWIVQYYNPAHRVSRWNQATNDYLQTAIQWGLLGFAVWAVLMLGWCVPFLRPVGNAVDLPAAERAILLACSRVALLVVLLHVLFDYPLQVASLQLVAIMYLAINWAWAKP